MLPFGKCPVCSGQVVEKELTEVISGGGNTVALKVTACICCHCSERFYSVSTIRNIERIKAKLEE